MRDDYFITGTDTNVGKTVLSALAGRRARRRLLEADSNGRMRRNRPPNRDAPGRSAGRPNASRVLLLRSAGFAASGGGGQRHHASILHGSSGRLVLQPNDPLIVEGAGGIAVPVNDSHSMLDVVRKLDMPVVVASRSALGTINHTVLTVNALRIAGADVRGVVMIGKKNKDNERSIERFAQTPVMGRIPPLDFD